MLALHLQVCCQTTQHHTCSLATVCLSHRSARSGDCHRTTSSAASRVSAVFPTHAEHNAGAWLQLRLGVRRDEQVSRPAIDAVRHVLSAGSWSELALEAVQLVADLIRKRKCSCSPQVLFLKVSSSLGSSAPQLP